MGRSRHTDPAQPRHRLETRRASAADQPEPAAHRFQSHSARRGAQVCRRLNLSIWFDRCVVGQRAVDRAARQRRRERGAAFCACECGRGAWGLRSKGVQADPQRGVDSAAAVMLAI